MAQPPDSPALTSAAGLVSGLTEKLLELESAVLRQAQRLSAVLDIGTALSSARDIDALLQLVIDRLKSLLKAEAATLFMLDSDKKELWSRVLTGSTLKEIRLPADKGLCGHVVATGQGVLIGDAYADSRFNPEVDRSSGLQTRALIAAPLRHVSGRILGVVEVLHHEPNAFTPDDKALVDAVGSQIAAVLDNVLLYEQLRQQNAQLLSTQRHLSVALQELDLLFEVEKAISTATEEAELFGQVLDKARAALGVGAASIHLLQEEMATLFVKGAGPETAAGLRTLVVESDQGIAGHVALTGNVVRLERASDSSLFDAKLASELGVGVAAVLCLPIVGEGRKLGALELMNKPEGFSAADERLATLLAGQIGRAILSRRSREEGERRARLAAIGQMLSSVVHDFRTPMTIISGFCQMLAASTDPKERAHLAETVERQLDQLNAMMHETLAFARGDREVLLRNVYFQRFMEEVAENLKLEFANSPVKLRIDVGYNGPARVDDGKLKRVIHNIARNALQAMPQGGHFEFAVAKEGDELVMRFDDDGPGIPPEIANRVFESFVTAGKPDGTGLGLAIVKKVVEEHGGEVHCRSEPGKGAHFEVRVPLGV